jgi:hypothetical protein
LANKIFLVAAHLHPGKNAGEVICEKIENLIFVRAPGFLLGLGFELAFVFFESAGGDIHIMYGCSVTIKEGCRKNNLLCRGNS